MPAFSPKRRASYEHDAITPAPTITGLPFNRGSRCCSMLAKKASISTWRTTRSMGALRGALAFDGGHCVVRAAIQRAAGLVLADAAPLLEEESDLRLAPLSANAPHPAGFHR